MLWTQNKSRLGIVGGLLLTTFVTACVKNASKDTNPHEVPFKELQSVELNQSQINGQEAIQVREDSDVVAARLTQTYQFTTHEIRDFAIQSTSHHNLECRVSGPFDYKISLIGPDGVKKTMRGSRNAEQLLPGSYILQVEVENSGLCQKIVLDINLKSTIREDLVLTEEITSGFVCNDVEENGVIQSNTVVRVNTHPMQILKYTRLNSGQMVPQQILDDNVLCQIEKDAITQCKDELLPTLKENDPFMATQRNCQNESQNHERGFAHLLVKKAELFNKKDVDFTCRHKRNNLTLKLKNCDSVFNLGQSLPIQAGQTDIILRRNLMRVAFEPIFNEIKDGNIPNDIHVGLVKKVQEEKEVSYYEPVQPLPLPLVSKDDLMDGQVTINQINLKQMVLAHDTKDLVLIFSRTPNMRQGLYHIEFSKLCSEEGNSLLAANPGGRNDSLCE